MEGIDIFNMKPLDAPYKGTIEKPVMVRSAGEEQFVGCTGFPKDSHEVLWLGVSFLLYYWSTHGKNIPTKQRQG